MAIDLPYGPWGCDSGDDLKKCVESLDNARYILGDSQSLEVIKQVRDFGPYDCVLIDGDHRYESVKRDYENYACEITAFHDIDTQGLKKGDMEFGVYEFWQEIKGNDYIEIIDPSDNRPMGIGVRYARR